MSWSSGFSLQSIIMPKRKAKFTNRPPHIKLDQSYYFITAKTINGQWFLRPAKYKQILFDKIIEKTRKFNTNLIAYVILANHYHLIIKIDSGKILPKMMAEINGASSRAINSADGVINRKIWWNYFDHVIRNEKDFFSHLNYIHQNPIKHGESKNFEYEFSSYKSWQKQKGSDYLEDAFRKYPIIDFMVLNDEY